MNTIPIKKMHDATGEFYPLNCTESVFTTTSINVNNEIGGYKKGDTIPAITDTMTIWKKLFSEVPVKPETEIIEEPYVHVDGTTYIDTGVIGKTGIKVEVKYAIENCRSGENPTRYPCLIGSYKYGTNKIWRFHPVGFWDRNIKVQYGSQYGALQTFGSPYENVCTYICEIKKDGIISTEGIDHTDNRCEYSLHDMKLDIDTGISMYLFADHFVDPRENKDIAQDYFKGKLYYCKIWDTETNKLIRNYIPVDLSLLPEWSRETTYFENFEYKCGLYETIEKKICVDTNDRMTCSNGCMKLSNLWGSINGQDGVSYTIVESK